MQTVTKDVKVTDKETKKMRKVGEVECPVYENIDELIATESAEKVLGLFNKANIIRIQANERAKHTEVRAGKMKRRMLAINTMTPVELAEYAGKVEDLYAYADSDKMQAKVDALTASSD